MERERVPAQNEVKALPGPDFGWWYLDFLGDDGTRINAVVHQTDIFGLEEEPRVSLTIFREDNPPLYLSTSLEGVDFSNTNGSLNLPGFIKEQEGKIQFCFEFPNGTSFQGTIDRCCKPFAPNGGILHQDKKSGARSNWVVVLPHGIFQATLKLKGRETDLHGSSYIDRQFGTERIQDFAGEWLWGHFASPEESFVFYQITTKGGQEISGLICASEAEVSFTEGIYASHLPVLREMKTPENADLEARITQKDGAEVINFGISNSGIMRTRVEKLGSSTATYVRWATVGTVVSREIAGITEYMRIRGEKEKKIESKYIIFLAGFSGAGKTTLARLIAKKYGLTLIEARKINHQLKKPGFKRTRDLIRTIGREKFLKRWETAVIEKMREEPTSKGFIVDGIANADIIERVKQVLPQATILVINVRADDSIRTDRIANRENLKDSEREKELRNGFLRESGMEQVTKTADFTVVNEGPIEEAAARIIDFVKQNYEIKPIEG